MRGASTDRRPFLPPLHTQIPLFHGYGGVPYWYLTRPAPVIMDPLKGITVQTVTEWPVRCHVPVPAGAKTVEWVPGPDPNPTETTPNHFGHMLDATNNRLSDSSLIGKHVLVPGTVRLMLYTDAREGKWLRHGGQIKWGYTL